MAIVFDRIMPCPFHFEHDAEIVMGFGVIGSQFGGASIVVQGPVEIVPFFQQQTQLIVGPGVGGDKCDGLLEMADRIVLSAYFN